jgi:hypothetical protein
MVARQIPFNATGAVAERLNSSIQLVPAVVSHSLMAKLENKVRLAATLGALPLSLRLRFARGTLFVL